MKIDKTKKKKIERGKLQAVFRLFFCNKQCYFNPWGTIRAFGATSSSLSICLSLYIYERWLPSGRLESCYVRVCLQCFQRKDQRNFSV